MQPTQYTLQVTRINGPWWLQWHPTAQDATAYAMQTRAALVSNTAALALWRGTARSSTNPQVHTSSHGGRYINVQAVNRRHLPAALRRKYGLQLQDLQQLY